MKTTKRFLAMTAALTLTACVAIPMTSVAATAATGGSTITITNNDSATHSYAAYQIFSGEYSGNTLNSIDWGDGVDGSAILTALHTASAESGNALEGLFPNTVNSAAKVAEVLGSEEGDPAVAVFGNDSAKAQAFAEIVAANLTETTSGNPSANVISQLPDGYYIVMDSEAPANPGTNDNSGAKTRYILRVAGGESVSLTSKNAAPTVDKQVADDEGSNPPTWDETADHAINESFQFKLTATLTADDNYAAYNTYRVKFNDTLNSGVTYESIESITVNGNIVTEYVAKPDGEDTRSAAQKAGYIATEPSYTNEVIGGGQLTIEIGDIKQFLGESDWADEEDVTVEVIYNAHLNKNAAVENDSDDSVAASYDNVNKVNLQYSNNPNVEGSGDTGDTPGDDENEEEFGETPDDYVWVFTYEVDNTKLNENDEPMGGAGFTLYSGSTAVKLIDNGDGTYTVADQSATTGVVTEMTSRNGSGIFNIKGLDAGIYTLSETNVPDGYNKCDDITITINPTHTENTGGATANLALDADSLNFEITNTKGSNLPSTGGMGTRLFVLGGGATAALAGIYLVSRRRTKEELDD